ncbi:hypothetical protein ACFLTU_05040 [Bacteroidota bacterium]
MNKLDNYIQTNRDKIDGFEPSEGHMEKFRKKLYPAPIPFYARLPYGLKVAAVLLLVAISSVLIYEQSKLFYISRHKTLQENVPGEFGEAQIYYTSLIDEKHSEIDQMNISDPEQKELLMKELVEMDRLFHNIQEDLKTNPKDERILSAMITHYQMKLEVMGQILYQLENANQLNSTQKSHENTEI